MLSNKLNRKSTCSHHTDFSSVGTSPPPALPSMTFNIQDLLNDRKSAFFFISFVINVWHYTSIYSFNGKIFLFLYKNFKKFYWKLLLWKKYHRLGLKGLRITLEMSCYNSKVRVCVCVCVQIDRYVGRKACRLNRPNTYIYIRTYVARLVVIYLRPEITGWHFKRGNLQYPSRILVFLHPKLLSVGGLVTVVSLVSLAHKECSKPNDPFQQLWL